MEEEVRNFISPKVDENIEYLKELFKDNSDMVFREFYIGEVKSAIVYIDGMGDKMLLNDLLRGLMTRYRYVKNVSMIKERLITVSDMKEFDDLKKGIDLVLSGETLMLIEGLRSFYVLATRAWPARGISEPSGETVLRGSRDGFTETLRFNTALIRRRIRDTRLKIVPKPLGVRSKTDVVVMYIDDIVNSEALKELMERLDNIKIDAILDSGYVEQLIEDSKWSLFPQIQSTERPDVVASALYEGRIAIIVDNSPFAIIVPTTMANLFQSPDDYYQRWIYSSTIRVIRFISIIITLIMPAFYVAVTSFHTGIIPTRLAYFIAASREGVPFPAFMEAIIMELSFALLLESVARLPKSIGATTGIVGGLIIGQAAVQAGIVSPIMIIIVSVTAITNFTTPNYEMTSAFRMIRFLLIIAAAVAGLYGIMIGLILTLIHLVRLKSFGISYLSPMVSENSSDFKDMYLRAPINFFKNRPKYMNTKDKVRQK
ncbi:spore germination protein [Clostridium luticellarii]|uniref:Spore germination protein B1 n=1 Tax=Clostridium luticellarii TaxID=1691940 RepID=A0A2T0BB56_9CLOT|nr:spore germination protein [Clostridium luticellarii]MCI1945282.1 spore germination protein [Clostridium luticellarii]MCI1968657.1 spore germination protein [Clostridium luticellarii]MCI1995837.1 spore germination protein [Clostridium luticellarii]MCI2040131.1 spore germination protein [Clostridium luticellarii]PRR81114.1 Spore germination protein B1 [Clostridium luticellarii]